MQIPIGVPVRLRGLQSSRKGDAAPFHKINTLTSAKARLNLLTVRERVLLFCAASGTDWGHAGIPSKTVTAMIVKGTPRGGIAPTDRGHAVLRVRLHA